MSKHIVPRAYSARRPKRSYSVTRVFGAALLACSALATASPVYAVETGDNGQEAKMLPNFTAEQVVKGEALYKKTCVGCHGADLTGSSFAPPITGDSFYGKWGGRPVKDLFAYVQRMMPPGGGAELSNTEYAQVLSYLFSRADIAAGEKEMPANYFLLWNEYLPIPEGGVIEPEVVEGPPPPTPRPNPLKDITQVSDEALLNPPESDWLMWRRTYDAKGHSPLRQITPENARHLSLAWSWSLPQGRNTTTPLVHDGVMFTYASGGIIQALDAKNGNLLWEYEAEGEKKNAQYLRAIALYEGNVIFPAGNGYVIAIDMKTGKEAWATKIKDSTPIFAEDKPVPYMSGGPLAVNGNIIMGTTTIEVMPGRSFIFALDAKTGKEKWRFHTVAMPDEPGGDSWNNIPAKERIGVGAWIPGSYDPETKLVYFGTGNTNKSVPKLRELEDGAVAKNALYTNSTLALKPESGTLAWYHQHLSADQWCHDEVFERTLTTLPVDGKTQKVMINGGKQGIFDVLDAYNGKYKFSIDLGLQNVVESIDPLTGERSIAPEAVSAPRKEIFVCPSNHGVRNWRPTSFDPTTNLLYVPIVESCMKMRPPQPGDYVYGDLGQLAYPRPDSDGNFGALRAINMKTRETVWEVRQRAIPTSGVLTTAGGVLFNGALDREFAAYRSDTGEKLWHARLNSTPGGGPISYMVDGKQYIAVVTGHTPARNIDGFMAPEIVGPKEANPTVWVFHVPD